MFLAVNQAAQAYGGSNPSPPTQYNMVVVVQLAERRVVDPEATGSSPVDHPTQHAVQHGAVRESGLIVFPAKEVCLTAPWVRIPLAPRISRLHPLPSWWNRQTRRT